MKKTLIILATIAVVFLGRATLSQTPPTSLKLTDTIKQGTGVINLLNSKDGMTAPMLEAFRLEAVRFENAGKLSFAVDVNENASGLETSQSQGVAIASASIEITFADGSKKIYSQFSTGTQAVLAPRGSTVRQLYYTLLGDAGSSSITPRRINNQDFDSTLKFVVQDDLSTATAAVLYVQLLNTDPALGDPENFYDYGGGFEDVAIITSSTSKYLDEVLPLLPDSVFRSQAPAMQLSPEGVVTQQTLLAAASPTGTPSTSQIIAASNPLSWIQRPGASTYSIVAYEDLYPSKGDYDFNDTVVAYRYQLGVNASGMIERVDGVAYLVARGSNYTHNWTLDIPLPPAAASASPICTTKNSAATTLECAITVGGGKISWKAFAGTRLLLPPESNTGTPQRNTIQGKANIQGPKSTFSFTFDAPIALADWGVDDPWLHVIDTNQDIHNSTKDSNGFPFALNMPSAWQFAQEGVDMGLAYPSFANFVKTSGAQSVDWYLKPDTSKTIAWTATDWAW